jgi:hypothetical protein
VIDPRRRGIPCVFFALAVLGCKRGSAPSSTTEPAPPAPTASAASTAHPLAAPRCKRGEGAIALGGASATADLEIGDAIAARGGFVVGLLRESQGGVMGSMALFGADTRPATFVDLGPPAGDAPPPKPVARGDGQEMLLAAFYGRPQTDGKTRELMLFEVTAGKPALLGVVEEEKDDSLAFDIALGEKGGVVVWDEDEAGARGQAARGVIKALALSAAAKPIGAPRIISGSSSDAELPRVVARRGGFWVAYLAHAPESPPLTSASASRTLAAAPKASAPAGVGSDLEEPGTDRSFGWVEMLALDGDGAPLGTPRRVTSEQGHVTDFELATRSSQDAGKDAVDLFVRDEGEIVEGSGGRILRASVRVAGADPPAVVVPDSVGAGKLELVSKGASTLLFYGDGEDEVRAVPLGDARLPSAPPSIEAALGGGRILGSRRDGQILVTLPREAKTEAKTGKGDSALGLASCEMP